MQTSDIRSDETVQQINALIESCGGDSTSFKGELIAQMIQNNLKLIKEDHDTGQIKLMLRSTKEMRYAYRIFNDYREKGTPCVSIFGSARTPENHPDYIAAQNFGALMASHGWMCITGAANGIMKAGLEGAQREASFGLSIKLPFESPANSVIAGDVKLISFRYFFTRKLMFMSHANALVAFPGGFGTLDELFEVLTLQQTGKAQIMPVVLLEGEDGGYWSHWLEYLQWQLLNNGWISPEDQHLYYQASSPYDAVRHILQFYRNYHSSRYVKENLVLRLKKELTQKEVAQLNLKYQKLIANGEMSMCKPFPEETDHLDLPRLTFHHTHCDYGLLRSLIDDINLL